MGKLVNGIHGPFIGKVGNVIGSSWRGIHYMKSRGLRTKPATEGEKLNRFIFGMTQQWLNPITAFLRVGFKDYTPTNQGINAAKSYLYKHALIKDGYDSFIDPSLVKVSHGPLPFPDRMEVELNNDNELIFTWDKKIKNRDEEFDQILLLAYDIDEKDCTMSLNGQFRKTGRDELDINGLKNFVVYAAFVSADRTSRSDSVYLGAFTDVKTLPPEEWTAVQNKKLDADSPVNYDNAVSSVETESNARWEEFSEVEQVDPNQLNLFVSLDEVTENRNEPLKFRIQPTETTATFFKAEAKQPEVIENTVEQRSDLALLQDEDNPVSKPELQAAKIHNTLVERKDQITFDSPQKSTNTHRGEFHLPENEPLKEVRSNLPDESTLTTDKSTLAIDEPAQTTDKPSLTKGKDPDKQKFTYVNPNIEVESKIPDSTDIKKEDDDEKIVIKKDKVTYFTTMKHLRNINIGGGSDPLKD